MDGGVQRATAFMKKILVIKAHPREGSFCNALVNRYIEGAKQNDVEIEMLDLRDLALEPWLKYDWGCNHDSQPSSPDLDRSKELIDWSSHIAFFYPTFWATPPALLILFIEMVIVSGFAFKYHKPILKRIPRHDKLLKGRTATIMSTMDSPPFMMDLHDRDPGGKMMHDVLRFTGIKLTGKHYFGSVVMSSEKERSKWLEEAYSIGREDSR